MGLDIYFKIPEDPAYIPEETEIEDELDRFLQCVEMTLTTRRGDVLGEPQFGANLEDYLWSTRTTSEQVQSEIRQQLGTYCSDFSSQIKYDVEVSFLKGEITDSMFVDITIDGTKILGIAVNP